MTQDHDEIVVFTAFDSPIEANLAKTKLDAYGIPCFLTEENMASLYPGQQSLAFQVRLHVFEKDIDEVSKILMAKEGNEHADLVCPKCKSSKIERQFPKSLSLKFLSSLSVIFFGIFFPGKKINHCMNCDNEF